MTKRTPQEIDAMEQEVRDYREAERRAADQAAREAAEPMIALLDDGTLQRLLDALPALDQVTSSASRFPTLRSGVNALRVGLESVVQELRSMPPSDDAQA